MLSSKAGLCRKPELACLGRYLPVVPMVLINGAEGIGTGWSTYIPNYSPREVSANLRRLLNGEEVVTMQPWYKGFKGTIQEAPSKTAGKSYNVYGTVAQAGSPFILKTGPTAGRCLLCQQHVVSCHKHWKLACRVFQLLRVTSGTI